MTDRADRADNADHADDVANSDHVDDYDPMIYDAMREAANRLRGLYVARQNEATTEEERQRWLEKQISVRIEADAVDTFSLEAVQALRASFVARCRAEEQ